MNFFRRRRRRDDDSRKPDDDSPPLDDKKRKKRRGSGKFRDLVQRIGRFFLGELAGALVLKYGWVFLLVSAVAIAVFFRGCIK